MATNTTLNVRIEEEIKYQASLILGASGLFLLRVIEEKALPFDLPRPNTKTLNAIKAAKSGKGRRVKDSKALVKRLNARN